MTLFLFNQWIKNRLFFIIYPLMITRGPMNTFPGIHRLLENQNVRLAHIICDPFVNDRDQKVAHFPGSTDHSVTRLLSSY